MQGSLAQSETADSQMLRSHRVWEPEWIEHRFSCLLKCTNSRCEQAVAVAGVTSLNSYYDPEDGEVYFDTYHPKFVFPSPLFFDIPTDLPNEIQDELRSAFVLHWYDPSSAATRVRAAVEMLLDELKIARLQRKKGKAERLSLHARIKKLETKEPEHAGSLLAVKWIGNTGSHESKLSQADLRDAFEILEHVIGELLGRRSKRVRNVARAINRRRGPLTDEARRKLRRA